jgi:hypothetical protein
VKQMVTLFALIAGCSHPEPPTQAPVASAYEEGYRRGHRAWMSQSGAEIRSDLYAVLETSAIPGEEEAMTRGYIDGYHRASELSVCPAHW